MKTLLLYDFARLCRIEARTVHPKPADGEPDHGQRWSRNDRRYLDETASRVEMRLAVGADHRGGPPGVAAGYVLGADGRATRVD